MLIIVILAGLASLISPTAGAGFLVLAWFVCALRA